MSRGKEPRVSGAGIVANRAALAELGEWNYCLEERDSFSQLSSDQIRHILGFSSASGGYVCSCEARCASHMCQITLQ